MNTGTHKIKEKTTKAKRFSCRLIFFIICLVLTACEPPTSPVLTKIENIFIETQSINQDRINSTIIMLKGQTTGFKAFAETNNGNIIDITQKVRWFFSVNLQINIDKRGNLTAGPYTGITELSAAYQNIVSAPYTIIIK